MIIVDKALERRQLDNNPIRVGMVGAGYMGQGMAAVIERNMVGMQVVAIANRTLENAERAFAAAGVEDYDTVADQAAMDDRLGRGGRAVTSDPLLLCRTPGIEAIIECTGEVEAGAQVATEAIANGKHVLLVNAELDATVGPILKVMADRAGVVVTNADGDEPSVAMNMFRFVKTIGYQPVLAGNVKGFLDHRRNPDTQKGFADAHGQRPFMVTSFADGTKLSLESTVLANATGFKVRQRGMEGRRLDHVRDLVDLYDPKELREQGLVEYVLGAEPGSGAFVIGYNDDPMLMPYMSYFKLGDGPLYMFYRPFHLTHLEAPLSVARAVLFGDATIAPQGGPVCEVATIAKHDLEAGEELDGIGGYTCYGLIDNVEDARRDDALPIGLAAGARLNRAVAQDQTVTYADVTLPEGRLVDKLRAQQADHFGSA
ncbi:MAG TPA: Gfo/Idh/MocA family oxidoreductase [Actinomycetota bacterium]